MGWVDLYSAAVFCKITNTGGEHQSWFFFFLSLSTLPFSVVPRLLIAFCFSGGCNEIRMLNIVFLYLLHIYRCWLQASLLLSCFCLSWIHLPQNYRSVVVNPPGQGDTWKKDVVHSPLLYTHTLLSLPCLPSFFFFFENKGQILHPLASVSHHSLQSLCVTKFNYL